MDSGNSPYNSTWKSAKREFEAGIIPMDVERTLPPKTKEMEIRVVVEELSAEE